MGKTAFESRTNAYTFLPEELVLINNPDHPLYDERIKLPIDDGLVRNIMMNGVIEPIVITKLQGQPVVVDGRQRVRCAAEANKRLLAEGKEPVRVTAVVRKDQDINLFGVSISANENRQDDAPLGRARKCARYLAMGHTEQEAAVVFGVSKTCITGWMKMLSCSTEVIKAVEKGIISASAATELSGLDHEEQNSALATLLEDGSGGEGGNGTSARRPSVRAAARKAGKERAKLRSRKEIKARIEEENRPSWREALHWVLNEAEDE
jgi:ParB family chromosome partitioning protein